MPLRVLVVEDEWLIAVAIQRQLEAAGYEVSGVVGTGSAALEACATDRPDVVFMDIQMPDMDGITATRTLMEKCPHPVVIVTGNASLQEAAARAGAMHYVVKPLLTAQLPGIIETARQRFAQFQVVHADYATCQEAIEAWTVIRQALQVAGDSEAAAFTRLQTAAAARGVPLRTIAEELLQQRAA